MSCPLLPFHPTPLECNVTVLRKGIRWAVTFSCAHVKTRRAQSVIADIVAGRHRLDALTITLVDQSRNVSRAESRPRLVPSAAINGPSQSPRPLRRPYESAKIWGS